MLHTPGAIPGPSYLAGILLRAPDGLPWLYEGPARHWLRAILCLRGEVWGRADVVAAVLIEQARELAGLPVPIGWDQNDYPGSIDYRRTNGHAHALCAKCERPIDRPVDGRPGPPPAYCSASCRMAAWWERKKSLTIDLDRQCAECAAEIPFEMKSTARFCSPAHALRARERRHRAEELARRVALDRRCIECSGPIAPTKDPRSQFCCEAHRRRAADRRARNGAANGHG